MSLMGSPQWAYASGEAFTVDQSLRFDKARTTYLRRDNASASTNGQKFTISCWVKHSGHPQSLGGSYDANGRPICCSVEQDENEDSKNDEQQRMKKMSEEKQLAKEEAEAILNALKASQNNLMEKRYVAKNRKKMEKDW